MGGDVAGARDDGLDVVNLMHGREDVPAMEVGDVVGVGAHRCRREGHPGLDDRARQKDRG